MKGIFKSNCLTVEHSDFRPTIDELNAELNFRNSTPEFVHNNAGPIVRGLTRLIESTQHYRSKRDENPHLTPLVDVRVNYLVDGTYPSLPGWHCDDIVRESNYKQPDVIKSIPTHHYMCLLADTMAENSNTEFLLGQHIIAFDQENVYKSINRHLLLNEGNLRTSRVPVGDIVYFDNRSLHRAVPATRYGVRMFYRLSLTYRQVANEIRKYNQCYVDAANAGW